MALVKAVDSAALNAGMAAVADAIRAKAGTTEPLAWPDGFKAAVEAISGGIAGEPYEGPHDVTPKVTAQTLPTAKKLMREDVSVRAIPYFDVSNPAGGNTIYIANEV